jgi:hypothetical protein
MLEARSRARGRQRLAERSNCLDPASSQYRPERCAEFCIAIVQHVATLIEISPSFVGRVAGHLPHPKFIRMPRDTGQAYPAALEVNEEQPIIGHQTPPCEHFDREEIHAGQNCHMRADELFPGCVLAPFRRWRQAMPPQDIADRLIR